MNIEKLKSHKMGCINGAYLFTTNKEYKDKNNTIKKDTICLGCIKINGGVYVFEVITLYTMGDYENFPKTITEYGSPTKLKEHVEDIGTIIEYYK